ncbi:MAG TPA: thioredoxin domain-containing protein [Candidatus Saccharimonadales bacterium]
MSKQFLGVIVAVILIFVGIFIFSNGKNPQTSSGKSNTGTLTQHIEGKGSTGVTLVEYGDYECPFCGQYFPTVKQVQADFNDQIKFQFRNFPLVSIHQNAFAAARAAEAAALQNKFWEMHDLLYEAQSQWAGAGDPTPFFNQYAQQLGLNLAQFKTDYASSKVNDLINADTAEGTKLNVQGTPSFFLDGKQINVGNNVSAFEKLINAEIVKKTTGSNAPTPTSAGTTSQTAAPAKQ